MFKSQTTKQLRRLFLAFALLMPVAVDGVLFAENIPRVSEDIPTEVSQVRFKSELTDAGCTSVEEIKEMGGLFASIFVEKKSKSHAKSK